MSNEINNDELNEQRRKKAENFHMEIQDNSFGGAEEINSYSGQDVKEQIARESKRSLKKKIKAEKKELKKRNKHNRRMFRWMWIVSVLIVGSALGIYVVTGVLYEGTPKYSDGIQIPSHFYKCLMKCSFSSPGIVSGAQGCAYVFTNTKHSNSNYSTGLVTIDSIETRAGFDFFPRVPEEYQEKAENGTSVFIL